MKRLAVGLVVAGVLTVTSSLPTSFSSAGSIVSVQAVSAASVATPNDIVQTARQYLGSPYAYIGNTPAGFSCIGFVNFVFHQNGVYVPFDIPMAWSSAPRVDESQLMPGDVLFFSNTVFAGLSHVAIYIGNGQMIGADSFTVGVTVDQVDDAYWSSHYTGATRPLALLGTSPMPGQAATATATPVGDTSVAPTPTVTPTAPPVSATAPKGSLIEPAMASVSLFSGPGYEYLSVGNLTQADVLTVVEGQEGWYNVHTSANVFGWVTAGSVKIVRMASDPSTVNLSASTSGLSQASAITGGKALGIKYVAVGPLWVRSGPSKSNDALGFVIPGSQLLVYASTPHWARIGTPAGLVGWVATQYLSGTPIVSTGSSTTVSGITVHVTVPALRVRTLPDAHSRVITVLFSGEKVQVLAQRSGWNEVKLKNGTIGWASAQYLSAK